MLTGDLGAARRAFHAEPALCRELIVVAMAEEGLRASPPSRRPAVTPTGLHVARRREPFDQEEDAVAARLEFELLAPGRGSVRAKAWDAAVRAGAALGFEDAMDYALEELSV